MADSAFCFPVIAKPLSDKERGLWEREYNSTSASEVIIHNSFLPPRAFHRQARFLFHYARHQFRNARARVCCVFFKRGFLRCCPFTTIVFPPSTASYEPTFTIKSTWLQLHICFRKAEQTSR